MAGAIVAKSDGYIQWEKQIKMATEDVERIDAALSKADEQEMQDLHREMDAKYQYAIGDWGNSLWNYIKGQGTVSDMDVSSLTDNLKIMRAKIFAFSLGMNTSKAGQEKSSETNVNVTVNNDINIDVSFAEAKDKIENMTSLSREETDEILRRIDELEKINSEKISKKNKWAKVKPILAFALDKGVDVAIAILSIVLQMNLGA